MAHRHNPCCEPEWTVGAGLHPRKHGLFGVRSAAEVLCPPGPPSMARGARNCARHGDGSERLAGAAGAPAQLTQWSYIQSGLSALATLPVV